MSAQEAVCRQNGRVSYVRPFVKCCPRKRLNTPLQVESQPFLLKIQLHRNARKLTWVLLRLCHSSTMLSVLSTWFVLALAHDLISLYAHERGIGCSWLRRESYLCPYFTFPSFKRRRPADKTRNFVRKNEIIYTPVCAECGAMF